LSRINWLRLLKLFGDRFVRSWKLVSEGRVIKYVFRPSGKVIWVVLGQGAEYLVYSQAEYCSCSAFYFRVIDGKEGYCYHLLAHKLSLVLGFFRIVFEEDDVYKILMDEWLSQM
jgi:predicted nucleic acid-binding Zn finger protein